MTNEILATAAISGIDLQTLKDKFPGLIHESVGKEYEKIAKYGDIIREANVMHAAITYEKLRVHFSEENAMRVLCAIMTNGTLNGKA
jgi:hypothetical protein